METGALSRYDFRPSVPYGSPRTIPQDAEISSDDTCSSSASNADIEGDLSTKKRDTQHLEDPSSYKPNMGIQTFGKDRGSRVNATSNSESKDNEAGVHDSASIDNTHQGNLYGSDEERHRRSAHHMRIPVSRTFSRRYIDPETLDAYGIGWKWAGHDDWNVFVNQDLTETLEIELRAHTKNIHLQRAHHINNNSPRSNATLPWRPMAPEKESSGRLRKNQSCGEGPRHTEALEREMLHTGRNRHRSPKSNNTDLARYNNEQNAGFECHLFDLQFESDVQSLLWEAGCSMEFCDSIIQDHAEKERRKTAFAQVLTDGEKAEKRGRSQTNAAAEADPAPLSRPSPRYREDVNTHTKTLASRNKPAANAMKTKSPNGRAEHERCVPVQ
ncbi:MAG: hypothetical protein Q9160_005082 [Pyrenula sp. 1 TL-2023]